MRQGPGKTGAQHDQSDRRQRHRAQPARRKMHKTAGEPDPQADAYHQLRGIGHGLRHGRQGDATDGQQQGRGQCANKPRIGTFESEHGPAAQARQHGQQRQARPLHDARSGQRTVQAMQPRPLKAEGNDQRDQKHPQAVRRSHQVGLPAVALGHQRHFRGCTHRCRKISRDARQPADVKRPRPFVHTMQPRPKNQPQNQRPDDVQHDGPPQAGHQRHHLRREIKPKHAADSPLPDVAQRRPALRRGAQHGQHGRRHQGANHPRQGCAQHDAQFRCRKSQQQGQGNTGGGKLGLGRKALAEVLGHGRDKKGSGRGVRACTQNRLQGISIHRCPHSFCHARPRP